MARDAAYFRMHRLSLQLSLELGCTPKEAAEEMRRREAHEKWRAGMDRWALRQAQGERASGGIDISGTNKSPAADAQPWMMRD